MILHVLFAQRKEHYDGQYGPEALAVMTEYDHDSNPDYLIEEESKALQSGDFESVVLLRLKVSDEAVDQALRPSLYPALNAEVLP